jgi:hypothetical protein
MKVTAYKYEGNWGLRRLNLVVWQAVCWQCGAVASHGYTEQEAVAVAQEDGWVDGVCFECWERGRMRWGEQWGIP